MGGGALGACEQESEGSVPGEVRHSLGGAKLTLSPSPSAASKEPGLRHTAASAAARPQLHHAHTHNMHARVWHKHRRGVRMCGHAHEHVFFFLSAVKVTRRNAISPDDRLEVTRDSAGKGENANALARAYVRAGGPL